MLWANTPVTVWAEVGGFFPLTSLLPVLLARVGKQDSYKKGKQISSNIYIIYTVRRLVASNIWKVTPTTIRRI